MDVRPLGHNKCTTPDCFPYTFEICQHSLQNIQVPHIMHVWKMCGAHNRQQVLYHGTPTQQCICERFRQPRSTQKKDDNRARTCQDPFRGRGADYKNQHDGAYGTGHQHRQDQQSGVQAASVEEDKALMTMLEYMGNPFPEHKQCLLIIATIILKL